MYPLRAARRDDYPFIVRSQTGSRLQGRTGDFHGYPFSVHGYGDWRNLAIALAVCKPGDTIIEIGSNIGTETIGFADIVGPTGTVHAFEPLPVNFDALSRSVALNASRRVVLHRMALGAEAGRLRFAVPPASASGMGHLIGAGEASADCIEVDCSSLDSLAAEVGSAKALFIDAEGAEVAILRGAARYLAEHRPAIVLEASPLHLLRAGNSLGELYELVRQSGYEPHKINRLGLGTIDIDRHASACNWLCTPAGSDSAAAVQQMIRKCGLLPCLPLLNPISRVARR